ncbi:response regulator transcription factor [Streptomyces sp. S.PNR 29]|uniref:response regulator n=1 Tax=Streptomyces sp. S.PNR 29 TaxID=2973805 RepID=UPI0025B140C1|nr:response regulator transcription factor [Streptomyces sp. S.PNR 29]MDN0200132.1 response regulator transcription factor [Streptomyces sp. S.PNR 29]
MSRPTAGGENITVVAEAPDGEEAVALARRERPDVCLLDIRMPKLDGLEATRMLAGPDVPDPLRVVVVTTFDLDEYVYGALRGGAYGFLLKDSGPTLLAEAVRAAAAGDSLVSPSVTVRLLRHVTSAGTAEQRPPAPAPAPLAEPLTERERRAARAPRALTTPLPPALTRTVRCAGDPTGPMVR